MATILLTSTIWCAHNLATIGLYVIKYYVVLYQDDAIGRELTMTTTTTEPKYSDVGGAGWRSTYEYRGIKYDIATVDTWFVLEYPKETAKIAELANEVNENCEFLYADAAHAWNDDQTPKQKFKEMANRAKRDIDWFLDDSLNELADHRAESENGFRRTADAINRLLRA